MNNSVTLYLTTILVWGTSWFAIRFQLGVVEPEVSLVYRFGLASIVLIIYCLLSGKSLSLNRSEHLFVAAQGLFLFCLNYLIFYIATPMLASGLIAVIFSSVILMNMFNASIFLDRPVDRLVLLGALLGLTGITLVFWPEIVGEESSSETVIGLVLSVIATYFASLGNILSARNQSAGLGVIQTNALGMGYGALMMLVYAFFLQRPFDFDLSVAYVGSLLYLSLFASIIAFGAYLTLIGRIGADRAAYATVLFPIVALAISSVFEDFRWTALSVGGVACVLFGNLLVTGLPGKKRRRARS